ncbi:hypothetical protein A6V36_27575 [Paraburkholderia ginsengiterrae]|uniref:Uncharacterized protein n=1 Tax=Paraburkholderia ginsengiterrae TaxID=1462993 RepID=A0A1A9NAX6_9BURK|nr:hypothetical protein A6V36_27575 [Paraburkholderia ginsengiterrae]OAJ63320.1 hypothetical protein A6V37_20725 [Paraburkholderia ginsengiterrae]
MMVFRFTMPWQKGKRLALHARALSTKLAVKRLLKACNGSGQCSVHISDKGLPTQAAERLQCIKDKHAVLIWQSENSRGGVRLADYLERPARSVVLQFSRRVLAAICANVLTEEGQTKKEGYACVAFINPHDTALETFTCRCNDLKPSTAIDSQGQVSSGKPAWGVLFHVVFGQERDPIRRLTRLPALND